MKNYTKKQLEKIFSDFRKGVKECINEMPDLSLDEVAYDYAQILIDEHADVEKSIKKQYMNVQDVKGFIADKIC